MESFQITLVCTALVHMGDKSDEVIIKNTQECKMIVIETTLELSWTANIGPFQITLGCKDQNEVLHHHLLKNLIVDNIGKGKFKILILQNYKAV